MIAMGDVPDPNQIAADEARIGALLRAAEVDAPAGLRRAIVARNAPRPRSRRVPAFALTFATACAAAAAALLVVGGATAPTVARAAQLALARPTASAPATLVASGTAIRFPDWSAVGWPASGVRHDSVGGRSLTTEFYRSYEGTIGYTISSGAPLRWGSVAVQTTVSGERYQVISTAGSRIVTWVQAGHTCILASRTASSRAMLALAAAERGTAA